jgi:hypothetical protein
MYVRWQHRTTARPTTPPRPVGLTSGAQEPATHDLALESEARAVATLLPRHPRRTNPRSRGSSEPRTSWVAVIVESRRVDGRPRQSLVRYVGTIKCSDAQLLSARRRFWKRADVVLAEFTTEERKRFERALAAKVPRPTSEEQAAAGAAFAARYRLPIPATGRATCRLSRTPNVATVVQPIPPLARA